MKELNRILKDKKVFTDGGGTFQNMWNAEGWLRENGYSHGSTDIGQIVAVKKGEYNLPQKWKNFDNAEKQYIDGYMYSTDYREGEVIVYLFN